MGATGIEELRTVADYQFGAGAGAALFPPEEERTIRRSTSGRPQQVLAGEGRVVSYGVDGRFTLGLVGGERLARTFPRPRCRVSVGTESVPFVADGKNAFCKFVREADPEIRPGDEVLVVLGENAVRENESRDENRGQGEEMDGSEATTAEPGTLLAVGRAELGAEAMGDFETGMAVKVRTAVGTPG
jgi:uncharacterized protein with predicted RNA binding PUA domain